MVLILLAVGGLIRELDIFEARGRRFGRAGGFLCRAYEMLQIRLGVNGHNLPL